MAEIFKLPELNYKYNDLEPHIDSQTMEIHYSKHHAAYIKNLNDAIAPFSELHDKSIEEILSDISIVPEEIKQTVINNGGGHLNHTMFWELLSASGGGNPVGALGEEIEKQFGGFENFKEAFKKSALGRFGSGWVWLTKDENEKLEIISTANQDNPLLQSLNPVLGLDIWEHAYYLKFQNRRADYVDAWWNVVDWNKANENFTR